MRRRDFISIFGGAAVAVMVSRRPSLAQSPQYPTRPIQLIVTFPPGGSADFVARVLADRMSALFGQQVAVVNKAGAAGTVGTQFVATAPGDGYTLVLTSVGALVLSPAMSKKSSYNTLRDFVPISLAAKVFEITVASKASGIHSLSELVAVAKQRPGKLTYGSTGIGSLPHVAGELLKLESGIDLVHVPYTGGDRDERFACRSNRRPHCGSSRVSAPDRIGRRHSVVC